MLYHIPSRIPSHPLPPGSVPVSRQVSEKETFGVFFVFWFFFLDEK